VTRVAQRDSLLRLSGIVWENEMLTVIQHASGLVLSIKTFRPLLIFAWHSSVWRQFPFRTCLATVRYDDKRTAEAGHNELAALLQGLRIGPEMSEPFQVIEAFCKAKTGAGVKTYRIYPGHGVEGRVTVEVTPKRDA
jgi:hypothetical protein